MKNQDYYSLKELKKLKFKKIGTNLEIKKSVKFFFFREYRNWRQCKN